MGVFSIIFFVLADLIAFILSVVGNFAVCYVIIKDKKLSRTGSKFILSVAVADFLVGLIVIPIGIMRVSCCLADKVTRVAISYLQTIDDLPHSFRPCWLLASLASIIYTISLYSLAALSIDRFWAICFPISHRNKNTRKISYAIIAISWIFPLINGVLQLFGYREARRKFVDKCIATTVLSPKVMTLAMFTITTGCVIMALLYSCIFCKLAMHVSKYLAITFF